MMKCTAVAVLLLAVLCSSVVETHSQSSSHTNNWAVLVSLNACQCVYMHHILAVYLYTLLVGPPPDAVTMTTSQLLQVCSSRYWFNYRHIANVLSMYRSVKRLGIPDR